MKGDDKSVWCFGCQLVCAGCGTRILRVASCTPAGQPKPTGEAELDDLAKQTKFERRDLIFSGLVSFLK
jgi:hypothetical protein